MDVKFFESGNIEFKDNITIFSVGKKDWSASGKVLLQQNPWLKVWRGDGRLSSELGSTLVYPCPGPERKQWVFVGVGDQEKLTAIEFVKIVRSAFAVIQGSWHKIAVHLNEIEVEDRDHSWKLQQIAQEAGDRAYSYNQFKEEKKPFECKTLLLPSGSNVEEDRRVINKAQAITKGMAFMRDFANMPANHCFPETLAQAAQTLAKSARKLLSTTVLEERHMQKLGMEAFLSVSAGSAKPAKLVVMDYQGPNTNKKTQPIVLVGKGITFDTGGISLKPPAKMDEMKFDMCGAASVLGTMKALIELQCPIRVVGLLACAENMPGSQASRPGDIVRTMSGQTVEVLNTDAEGRLVLCDTLTYAERYKPRYVVDMATLTGACIVALGHHASALMGNDESLINSLQKAGEQSHDRVWPLPLWDDYQVQLESAFADIGNIGGPAAGSITAGCFLARFAKKFPWAHLDIAGTAWNPKTKKASGRIVPLLTQWLEDLSNPC
jgi:leucyl aminopeptidase